jgi:serine protease Do
VDFAREALTLGWYAMHRLVAVLLALASCAPAEPPAAARAPADPAIVLCYDAERELVARVPDGRCQGEVIDAAREAALVAERRGRIAAITTGRRHDPVTGNLRLAGSGSGFFVGPGGEALTNHHVIAGCEMVTATPEGGAKLAVTVAGDDPARDIALLRAAQTPRGFARFTAAPKEINGRILAVTGYPAYGLPLVHPSVVGVSAMPLLLATQDDEVVFEGAIRRGHSGSPLLDGAGDVLGVVRAKPNVPKIFQATGKLIGDYGIAISQFATLRFLREHGVSPAVAPAGEALGPTELAEKMRGFVAQIGCWRS